MRPMQFKEIPTVQFRDCTMPVIPIIEEDDDIPPGTILALRKITSEGAEAKETQERFYVFTCPPNNLRFLFRVLIQLRSDNESWEFNVVGVLGEAIDDLALYRVYL